MAMGFTPHDRTKREHAARVQRVLWSDPETLAVILLLHDESTAIGDKEKDYFSPHSTLYRFHGRWEDNPRGGYRFRFSTVVIDKPLNKAGVVKYLTDIAPNVGRVTAEKLHAKYGSDAVEVLRTSPGRVSEDLVMSLEAAVEASKELEQHASMERTQIELFGLFAGYGFQGRAISAAIKKWGVEAPGIIRADPFQLLIQKIPSAGFKRCDKLYCDLGLPRDAMTRQMVCAWNEVRQDSDGHTWCEAVGVGQRLLEQIPRAEPPAAFRLAKEIDWLRFRRDESNTLWVAETRKATAEERVAASVIRLSKGSPTLWPATIPVSQTDGDGLPSEHQVEQLRRAFATKLGLFLGSPGTGKTHTLAFALRAIVAEIGIDNVAVCAPTGKAANRATQALRSQGLEIRATTIHRLLEIGRNGHDGDGWGFQRNLDNPLPQRVIVADETSMDDATLMADLLDACADNTHVLLVGDTHQLPPVGHGAPLRDLIEAGTPAGELTQVRRNAGMIVHACLRIKNGESFDTADKFDASIGHNLRHFNAPDAESSLDILEGLVTSMRAFDPVWQVQVIVGTNTKSDLSRVNVNKRLRKLLNPDGKRAYGSGDSAFAVNDKVICLKNTTLTVVEPVGNFGVDSMAEVAGNYVQARGELGEAMSEFVANGEIGRVVAVGATFVIARMSESDQLVKVPVKKGKSEGDDDGDDSDAGGEGGGGKASFDLAYAVTCHKMQGSEAPCVIVLADPAAGRIADRSWWYTAISRARELCIIIGPKATIDKQRIRQSLVRRKTFLVDEIKRLRTIKEGFEAEAIQ